MYSKKKKKNNNSIKYSLVVFNFVIFNEMPKNLKNIYSLGWFLAMDEEILFLIFLIS
jgi:hypothetical protein